mgnify:CR=1 FL=1
MKVEIFIVYTKGQPVFMSQVNNKYFIRTEEGQHLPSPYFITNPFIGFTKSKSCIIEYKHRAYNIDMEVEDWNLKQF